MRSTRHVLFTGILFGLVASGWLVHADPSDTTTPDNSRQPSDVTQQIQQQKSVIEQVAVKEAELLTSLDDIERQILRHNAEVAALTAEIEEKQQGLRQTQALMDMLTRRHAILEDHLKGRLRACYKWYRRGLLPILLSAPSYGSFVRREKYISDILRSDFQLFAEAQHSLKECAKKQQELTAQQQSLSAAKDDLTQKREQLMQARQEKTQILAKIRQEKSLQMQVLEELERNARELQTVVDRLPQQTELPAPPRMSFSMLKGKLPPPVTGKLISRFGKKEHPELHTSTFQKGIEISCPYGSEIRAVHDGTVVFADWIKGYGFVMIIDHGESYYSLLGHASKLLKKAGDQVKAGEPVALVGDSYSLQGACLYFEIRHHGKPQDPLLWLRHDFT